MSHARTHQEQLARRLSRTIDVGYQKALRQVQAAASAGRLPAVLDDAGMATALTALVQAANTTSSDAQPSNDENKHDPDRLTVNDLHTEVRDALAAHPAARAAGSTLLTLLSYDAIVRSGIGPMPLRRLYAFYSHTEAHGLLSEEQVRGDIAWIAEHLDAWIARQHQAQQDAQELWAILRSTYPLPTDGDNEPDPAMAALSRLRAVNKMPDHWVHQPWMQRLMGRWTDDLADAVEEARQWLAGHLTAAEQPPYASSVGQRHGTDPGSRGGKYRHPEPGPDGELNTALLSARIDTPNTVDYRPDGIYRVWRDDEVVMTVRQWAENPSLWTLQLYDDVEGPVAGGARYNVTSAEAVSAMITASSGNARELIRQWRSPQIDLSSEVTGRPGAEVAPRSPE